MTANKPYNIQEWVDKAHEAVQEPPRAHLGCSVAGERCDRRLWLEFRWAAQESFPGQVKRVFRRGRNEEASVVDDLRAIGCEVSFAGTGQQFIDFGGGHVGGSIDAVIERGLPGDEGGRYIVEVKTHSANSFKRLPAGGIRMSHSRHYAQMQLYMLGSGIHRGLYYAVCKDSDEVYSEIVVLDVAFAVDLLSRIRRISVSDRIPEPISANPTWYECKGCPAHGMCHKRKPTRHVNCRTCALSTPREDGTWGCERYPGRPIPVEFQRKGCDGHVLHPDMVPWKMLDSDDPLVGVFDVNGKAVRNGKPGDGVYSSGEMLADASFCAVADVDIDRLRTAHGARIV